jgi:hypothetical protein
MPRMGGGYWMRGRGGLSMGRRLFHPTHDDEAIMDGAPGDVNVQTRDQLRFRVISIHNEEMPCMGRRLASLVPSQILI